MDALKCKSIQSFVLLKGIKDKVYQESDHCVTWISLSLMEGLYFVWFLPAWAGSLEDFITMSILLMGKLRQSWSNLTRVPLLQRQSWGSNQTSLFQTVLRTTQVWELCSGGHRGRGEAALNRGHFKEMTLKDLRREFIVGKGEVWAEASCSIKT